MREEKRSTLYPKSLRHTEVRTSPGHNPWSACRDGDVKDRRTTCRQHNCMTSLTYGTAPKDYKLEKINNK